MNSNCTNTFGNYACSCYTGYLDEGMGYVCTGMFVYIFLFPHSLFRFCHTDIDECLDAPCHPNATCNNTEGSYTCECSDGFSGSGLNCTGMFSVFT